MGSVAIILPVPISNSLDVVVFRKLAFGGVKTQFQLTEASIAKNTDLFNARVDLARTRLGVTANEHIIRLTNMNINHHPLVKGIPFQQNPRFVGRDRVLEQLHRNLKSYGPGNGRQQSCCIHGIGGVGKTQIGLEYTYRYRYEYSHIFWVRAESNLEITTSFGNFAHSLLPSITSDDQNRNVALMLDWLAKSKFFLAVLNLIKASSADASTCRSILAPCV
jgi:hypothetical protein